MPNELRVRGNFAAGALDAALAIAGTTMSSPGLADLPIIDATNHAAIVLFIEDANGRITKKEILWVTAHSAAAVTATVLRGQEGTTDQAWAIGDKWEHTATVQDFPTPGCFLYHSTTFSLPATTLTPLPFNSEEYDYEGFHDNATNNTRITVPAGKAGWYILGGNVGTNPATTALRRLFTMINKNGVGLRGRSEVPGPTGSYPTPFLARPVFLVPGDYVELAAYSDGALTIESHTFWAHRLSA